MDDNNELFDPNENQICNTFNEMKNRIDCYLKRKREENNERTIRSYAELVSNSNNGDTSRTCSTIAVKRQKGSECFVKKSKVHNAEGPQLNSDRYPAVEKNINLSSNSSSIGQKSDVCERISNIEKCLNIESTKHDIDIYEKLKAIEDHVLQLESKLSDISKNASLSNIQMEILSENSMTQEDLDSKDNSMMVNLKSAKEISNKSKYTADDIQKFIDDIKRNDKKQTRF